MDTPEKNQRSTSTSHVEDSPVFCYINNLSPIQPVKSIPNSQTFNSLNFTSPQSLFTSPHTNSHEEAEFFKRNHCTYPSKPEFSDLENEENTSEGTSDAFQQCDLCTEQPECLSPDNLSSGNCRITTARHNRCSRLIAGLPKSLKHDTAPQMESTSASLAQDASEEKIISLERDVELAQNFQVEQNEAAGCDWEKFSDANDQLINDLSILEESSEGQDCTPVDPEMTCLPAVLQPLHDNIKDLSVDSANSCEQCSFEIHVTDSSGAAKPSMTDQVPETLSSALLESKISSDLVPEMSNEEEKSIQSSGKRVFNQQRSVRRLVFEMSGVHKRTSIHDNSGSSSILLQSNCQLMLSEKQRGPARPGSGYLSTMLPRVGLRLNAFASSSNNVSRFKHETLASGRPLRMPSSNSSSNTSVSGQKALLLNQDFIEKDSVLHDEEAHVMEDDTSSLAASKQLNNQDSPEKKRRKTDDAEEHDLCKRCNCKKSKCLKLYCECFAAGLYCVDPCSCQDCFNKPSHEDTVLETRRQIESRNPLAFAPKVIRSSVSHVESGDNSIKTPASARHKRGCNCKKSNCLKKYCECFQGGVGCSIGCRCEGCKNTFGRRDGMEETEFKEETETCENIASVTNAESNLVHSGEEEHLDTILPITPTPEIARPLVRLPFSFGSKPLQASLLTAGSSPQLCTIQGLEKSDSFCHLRKFSKCVETIPKDEAPEIQKTNYSPTKGARSSSPNCKRVSPPHCKSGSSLNWRNSRKLILRSIPSFPSLVPQHGNNNSSQQPS